MDHRQRYGSGMRLAFAIGLMGAGCCSGLACSGWRAGLVGRPSELCPRWYDELPMSRLPGRWQHRTVFAVGLSITVVSVEAVQS